MKKIKPSKSIKPSTPIKPSKSIKPSTPIKPSKSIEPSKPIETSKPIRKNKSIKPSTPIRKNKQNRQSKPIKPPKQIKHSKSVIEWKIKQKQRLTVPEKKFILRKYNTTDLNVVKQEIYYNEQYKKLQRFRDYRDRDIKSFISQGEKGIVDGQFTLKDKGGVRAIQNIFERARTLIPKNEFNKMSVLEKEKYLVDKKAIIENATQIIKNNDFKQIWGTTNFDKDRYHDEQGLGGLQERLS